MVVPAGEWKIWKIYIYWNDINPVYKQCLLKTKHYYLDSISPSEIVNTDPGYVLLNKVGYVVLLTTSYDTLWWIIVITRRSNETLRHRFINITWNMFCLHCLFPSVGKWIDHRQTLFHKNSVFVTERINAILLYVRK